MLAYEKSRCGAYKGVDKGVKAQEVRSESEP
jgi:hypothetical protein